MAQGFGSIEVFGGIDLTQVDRLIQLIREYGADANFSKEKMDKIVALVERSLKMGVPEVEDLKNTLENIGRGD